MKKAPNQVYLKTKEKGAHINIFGYACEDNHNMSPQYIKILNSIYKDPLCD